MHRFSSCHTFESHVAFPERARDFPEIKAGTGQRELRTQGVRGRRNCLRLRQNLVTQIATLHELFSAEPGQAAFGRFRSGLQGSGDIAPSLFFENAHAGNGLD